MTFRVGETVEVLTKSERWMEGKVVNVFEDAVWVHTGKKIEVVHNDGAWVRAVSPPAPLAVDRVAAYLRGLSSACGGDCGADFWRSEAEWLLSLRDAPGPEKPVAEPKALESYVLGDAIEYHYRSNKWISGVVIGVYSISCSMPCVKVRMDSGELLNVVSPRNLKLRARTVS